MDMGCLQSVIQPSAVPGGVVNTNGAVNIQCVHGDQKRYSRGAWPTAEVNGRSVALLRGATPEIILFVPLPAGYLPPRDQHLTCGELRCTPVRFDEDRCRQYFVAPEAGPC